MKQVLAGIAAVAAVALSGGTAGAQDAATITLLHGIPGATVDVAVDGAVVIPGFEPGTTQDLTAFAGQTLMNVEVRAAGTETVVERTMYDKDALPRERIWRTTGNETLVLITCGGSFNPDIRRYRQNIVVYAVPVA